LGKVRKEEERRRDLSQGIEERRKKVKRR